MNLTIEQPMENIRGICDICKTEIGPDEQHHFDSKMLCEDCCMDVRMPRKRKTHWQYIKSVKLEYLIK